MATVKNTQTDLNPIEEKLDQLIYLLAAQPTGGQSVTQAAPLLKRLRLTNVQIATVLGTTRNTIAVRLAEASRMNSKRNTR
jgi:hypothetical protein